MANLPMRTSVSEGRKRLRDANFTESDVNAGSRAELWITPTGLPALVSYIGPRFGEDFSTESLEDALSQV